MWLYKSWQSANLQGACHFRKRGENVRRVYIISVNLGNVLRNKVRIREGDEKPKSAVPHEERNYGIGVQFAIWIFDSRFVSSTR